MKKLFFCVLVMLGASATVKAQTFTIADIIVDGYQRISPGIIYNLLPIGIGDTVTASTPAQIIRELVQSEYFDEIEHRQSSHSQRCIELMLLPGSRVNEVIQLLPLMLDATHLLAGKLLSTKDVRRHNGATPQTTIASTSRSQQLKPQSSMFRSMLRNLHPPLTRSLTLLYLS